VTGASLYFVGALGTKGAGGRGYRGELLQVEGGSPLSILLLGGCRDEWGWPGCANGAKRSTALGRLCFWVVCAFCRW